MLSSSVSARYAKSLFLLAKEKSILNEVRDDMQLLFESLNTHTELHEIITSPIIAESKKEEIFKNIFGSKFNELSNSFLQLIFKNKRGEYMVSMARNYIDLYKKDKNIKTAHFTTAIPVSGEVSEKVKKMVSTHYGAEIEMEQIIDESIIGGFVLRVEDEQFNASIKSSLNKLRKEIVQN